MMTQNFEKYRIAIQNFDTPENRLPDSLLMERSGDFSVFYAPFDHINVDARLVIVGITPGMTQAVLALESARSSLKAGKSVIELLEDAKRAASFGGSMRARLIDLLNDIGLQKTLGIETAQDLFGSQNSLVHFTSILRYPVFQSDKNFNKNPLTNRFFEHYVEMFIREISAFDNALILPLGAVPQIVMDFLMHKGIVPESRVLSGLPHPSGANNERIAYFLGRKPKHLLSSKTSSEKIDKNRAALIRKVSAY